MPDTHGSREKNADAAKTGAPADPGEEEPQMFVPKKHSFGGTALAIQAARAGHEVLLCGRTPREAIEVRVDGRAPIVVPGPVHTDPDTVAGPVDVVLLAVNLLEKKQKAGGRA